MGNHKNRLFARRFGERLLDESLRRRVQGGRGFVQNQHVGTTVQRARQGDPLPLSPAQFPSSVANLGVQSFGPCVGEGSHVRPLGGLAQPTLVGIGVGKCDVFRHRAVEQERVLGHRRQPASISASTARSTPSTRNEPSWLANCTTGEPRWFCQSPTTPPAPRFGLFDRQIEAFQGVLVWPAPEPARSECPLHRWARQGLLPPIRLAPSNKPFKGLTRQPRPIPVLAAGKRPRRRDDLEKTTRYPTTNRERPEFRREQETPIPNSKAITDNDTTHSYKDMTACGASGGCLEMFLPGARGVGEPRLRVERLDDARRGAFLPAPRPNARVPLCLSRRTFQALTIDDEPAQGNNTNANSVGSNS